MGYATTHLHLRCLYKAWYSWCIMPPDMAIMKKLHDLYVLRGKGYKSHDSLLEAQKLREELIQLQKEGKFNKVEDYVFKKMNLEHFWSENPLGFMYWVKTGAFHDEEFSCKNKNSNVLCLCGYCNKVWELLGNIFYASFSQNITDDINGLVENFPMTFLQKKYVEKLMIIQNMHFEDSEVCDIDYKLKVLGCFHIFPAKSLAHKIQVSPLLIHTRKNSGQ
jgi:hypothetical protein